MKMLTLHQPWASLIAVGAKTIETRSWSTDYRGPLAIHAADVRPTTHRVGDFWCEPWYSPVEHVEDCCCEADGICEECAAGSPSVLVLTVDGRKAADLPLGAVVAVCDLAEVVPIVDKWPSTREGLPLCVIWGSGLYLWPQHREAVVESYLGDGREPLVATVTTDQLPFGDFTPGRYAWLLDNVHPIDPIPCKGFQGLRDCPVEVPA